MTRARPSPAPRRPPPPLPGARRRLFPVLLLGIPLALLALLGRPGALTAQGSRVGLTFGGTGLVGLTLELGDDQRAVELTLGTWAFRDVSVSVVGKERFGAAAARPVVGLGLWAVFSFPPHEEGDLRQNGVSILARAPFGVDWNLEGDHHFETALNLNKALWIRRTRVGEDVPVSPRIVPFPGFAYRWAY